MIWARCLAFRGKQDCVPTGRPELASISGTRTIARSQGVCVYRAKTLPKVRPLGRRHF